MSREIKIICSLFLFLGIIAFMAIPTDKGAIQPNLLTEQAPAVGLETEVIPETEPAPDIMDINALISQYGNSDIVGYLKIEGTSIDYPVVQSSDNAFYLTHDIRKAKNAAGWIFLDYENDVSKEDKNMIIYGHNMRNDVMFHALRYYEKKSFYDANKYIKFDTLYGTTTWEIFACYIVKTDFYYIQTSFQDDNEFMTLVDGMKNYSLYDTGVAVTPEDRVLTLSTCTGRVGDSSRRLAVSAKLIH